MALRGKRRQVYVHQQRSIEHSGFYPYLIRYLEQRAIEGMSEATLRRRDNVLRQFIEWCDGFGLDAPQEITKPIVERYQKYLFYYRKANGDPLSSSSQHVALSAIKQFFRWLTRENHLLYNPASELVLPRRSKHLPRYILSVEEVRHILDQPDIQTASGLRDRAMLETLYATGIRRTELCDLGVEAFDTHRQVLLIRQGKGDKDRYVPLGQTACRWIQQYYQDIRPSLLVNPQDSHLYLTDYGEPYTSSALGRMVKGYIQQAGLEVTGSCHLFRHAMATHMLDNGADVRFIQAILGHSDLSTTEIYTHVSMNQLQRIHESAHPNNQPCPSEE